MNKNLSFTVGISTRKAPGSLLTTIKHIRASSNVEKFPIIIVCDSQMEKAMESALKKHGIQIIINKNEGTLPQKFNQLINLVQTDLVIFTQDDLIFSKDTISNILKEFKNNKKLTTTFSQEIPLPPTNNFQRAIQAGLLVSYRLGAMWKNSDNYLTANGRCMCFKTDFARKINIPNDIISIDIYSYFATKNYGGFSKHVYDSKVYIKSPQNIQDHLSQSSRFQYSFTEVSKYLEGVSISDYQPPKYLMLRSFALQFFSQPIEMLSYLAIFIFTRFKKKDYKKTVNPLWKPNYSTKLIG